MLRVIYQYENAIKVIALCNKGYYIYSFFISINLEIKNTNICIFYLMLDANEKHF